QKPPPRGACVPFSGQKDQPGVGHFLGALVGTGRAVRLTEKGTHAPLGGGFWPISSVVDGCRAEPKLLSTTSMVPFPCLGEDVGRVFLSPRTESHEPGTRRRDGSAALGPRVELRVGRKRQLPRRPRGRGCLPRNLPGNGSRGPRLPGLSRPYGAISGG